MDALRQTYRFIESYHHRLGISPTEREIGRAFGLYTAAVTVVLMEYEPEVVTHVTDPRTGIPRKSNFLPTVAEVDKACIDWAGFVRMRDNLLAAGWKHENGKWIRPEVQD